jgi:hypothetical protein
MFGHHKLYRDGVPARSVIISLLTGVENTVGHLKSERMVDGDAIPQETEKQKVFFDVVADVQLGDGTTVQHKERLWRHQVGSCHIGDVLPARYDRHHHDQIVFDLPELEANRYSQKERADGQPPMRAQSGLAEVAAFFRGADPATLRAGDVQGLLGELMTDPSGFRDHMRQMAKDSGTNTFVFTATSTSQASPAETGFPVVDFTDEAEDI